MRGIDKSKMIDLPVRATVKEMEEATDMVTAAINSFFEKANATKAQTASTSPIGSNQKPRMLQLTAWIAHAGPPNRNDRAFTEEDLKEVVAAGLFQAPYFGMIDFNHDFEAYGVWYHAEYAFDNEAGQWGILAQGALFAWRYTELADKVLAMQQRNGYVAVSMSAMPGFYEDGETADGRAFLFVRKPVFFTTSLLDVRPADPFGRGVGSEDPEESVEARTEEMLRAAEAHTFEEAKMDELMKKIEAALAEMTEERDEITTLIRAATEELPTVRTELEQAQARITELDAALAEVTTAKAELETAKAELEGTVATLTQAKEKEADGTSAEVRTVEIALETARQELETALAKVTELEAYKTGIEEAAAAVAEKAKREERIKLIPEAALATLDETEREEMIETWMAQDETMFGRTVKLLTTASAGGRISHRVRSEREMGITTASDVAEGGPEFALIRKHVRNRA